MEATEFEFRHRTLINLLQIWLAFQLYVVDRSNVVWWLCPWNTPRRALLARVVFLAAALLVGFAALIRTWAAAYLGSKVVHDPAWHTESLVVDGPYRYVRNPLYLGSVLLSIGVGFLASRSGLAVLAGGGIVRVMRLIRREEKDLEQARGAAFREFVRRVPRLFPAFSARLPAAGVVPSWGSALLAEAPMWGFFATLIAFTVTLRDRLAWSLGSASLGLWLLLRLSDRLRKAVED
jgi:protein-S-isoprenylcysteine O-methyltransferase Ste14